MAVLNFEHVFESYSEPDAGVYASAHVLERTEHLLLYRKMGKHRGGYRAFVGGLGSVSGADRTGLATHDTLV
jgi:hypothetical protein